jgi:TnpA family transposase
LKATTEYNRLVKALYILNYMGDEELSKHVQRALNRGEAYHQLRRAIASVNGNRFRGSTDYEIELCAYSHEDDRLFSSKLITRSHPC